MLVEGGADLPAACVLPLARAAVEVGLGEVDLELIALALLKGLQLLEVGAQGGAVAGVEGGALFG